MSIYCEGLPCSPFEEAGKLTNYGYVFAENGLDKPYLFIGKNLLVTISPIKTEQHFDPERIEAWVYEPIREQILHKRFGLESINTEQLLFPGVIRLIDQNVQNRKNMAFYTFGASLIQQNHDHTREKVYSIRSNAPIIQLNNTPPSQEMNFWKEFAYSSDGEFAKIRAQLSQEHIALDPVYFLNGENSYRFMLQILLNKKLPHEYKMWLQKFYIPPSISQ